MGVSVLLTCKVARDLYDLPSESLGALLVRATGREIFENFGPNGMLQVFMAEKISDDVEDRYGAYEHIQTGT